jgi:hypothetical protein
MFNLHEISFSKIIILLVLVVVVVDEVAVEKNYSRSVFKIYSLVVDVVLVVLVLVVDVLVPNLQVISCLSYKTDVSKNVYLTRACCACCRSCCY